ncbi:MULTISPECIES: GNAT family N-acetyltransferase [Amycolatopsis]|uniref:GNAT family N-acetyltransferase n=1 Tax=Amycolatopsis dendrobii TaxID=2760662 RepID=A0A7W3VS73_9PSEU|nr:MULTISPECIES: GNAT family N-acetyltransferase [Amycolatopsis]MBB1152120.1 GNAT family N-acetyltransferase [Amycolatopsis dendrobii]UKD57604.1 GNAT family N-acetyltransferase [Amycolatopsis sp. FU40]
MLDVRLFDADRASDADWDALHELQFSAYRLDFPERPPMTREETISGVRAPQIQAGEQLVWTAHRDDRLVARAIATLPADGNEHLALVRLHVHPDVRRQGIGTELLHTLEPKLRALGRTRVEAWNLALGGPGERWAQDLGFRIVHSAVLQIMELSEADRARWDVAPPPGYRLMRWAGAAPEPLVSEYAKARAAIGDAPLGESEFGAPDWSADRVRRIEASYRERGIEHRTVAAVSSGGEVVGLTEMESRPLLPDRLHQGDTAVLAAHRGHGLGLAMKSAMLRWFTADRPGVAQVWTATGAGNTHMIAVNHRLGFATVQAGSVVSREL